MHIAVENNPRDKSDPAALETYTARIKRGLAVEPHRPQPDPGRLSLREFLDIPNFRVSVASRYDIPNFRVLPALRLVHSHLNAVTLRHSQ